MIVYQIRNQVNGKLYVGYTKQTIERRWRRHCKHASEGSHCALHRAIQKYGSEQFEITLLEESTFETVLDAEKHWIVTLNTMLPHGYNMTAGGDGTLGRVNSPEEREMRSRAASKRFENAIERSKMSRVQEHRKKRVQQLDTDGCVINDFPSISEAGRSTGAKHIRECCNGQRKSAAGFIWRWSPQKR